MDDHRAGSAASALATDLYEIMMMAGYHRSAVAGRATFELYTRHLPPNRSFLVAAGLEQALDYLEQLRFTPADIDFLKALAPLAGAPPDFFHYLARFKFAGDVWAMAEGVPWFPPEPILRVTAPLPEAQIVETALLAIVMFQTSVASRAARMVEAAAGRPVVEFGARRAHGIEAGVYAARAAFIAGCAATSNVEAGRRFGIPLSGTMAHSWVLAFPDEASAFRQYMAAFGQQSILLLDTFDTLAAARRVAGLGLEPRAVRLDSGSLLETSRQVRAILDESGLHGTDIFASGDLDEFRIADLVEAGAPVDGFGVGGALSTASDAPVPGGVYKLVEIERDGQLVPVMKSSPGKESWPGSKQVWRLSDAGGRDSRDIMALVNEPPPPGARPLLERVMADGRRVKPPEPLDAIRRRSTDLIARLPAPLRRLRATSSYRVDVSPGLAAATERLAHR